MKKMIQASIIFISLFSVSLKIAAAAQSKDSLQQAIKASTASLEQKIQILEVTNRSLTNQNDQLTQEIERLKRYTRIPAHTQSTEELITINASLLEEVKKLKKQLATPADRRSTEELGAIMEQCMAPVQKMLEQLTPAQGYSLFINNERIISKAKERVRQEKLPVEYQNRFYTFANEATARLALAQRPQQQTDILIESITKPITTYLIQVDGRWIIHPKFANTSKVKIRKDICSMLAQGVTADLSKSDLDKIHTWAERARDAANSLQP